MSWQNAAEYLLAGHPEQRFALYSSEGAMTFGELRLASRQAAALLLAHGACAGDRIILLGANSLPWVAAYLGALSAGLIAVPLPGTMTAEELGAVLDITEARFAFVQPELLFLHGELLAARGISLLKACPGPPGQSFVVQPASNPATAGQRPPRCDLAALMFTSGSTGKPRGVMVSHRNIVANTESILASLQLSRDDRMMAVLPFHYCFGASLLHTHLRVGASLVLENRFLFPELVLRRMRDLECTSFAGVPSHYQILLRKSNLARVPLPHLRSLQQAGGHLAPHFLDELQSLLPRARIYVMYGQTEATARLACLEPEALRTKPGSIGKAIPGVGLRVINERGEPALPGQIGEIVAEGDNITHGYWRDPEETARSFREHRLYTGDLATVDEEGFLFVVDRAKEFIKCGGTRIGCRQLEDQLLRFDQLLEAAVVGVPDDVLGEAVRAFVVPRNVETEGLEERLRAFCKTHLPRLYLPRDIVVLPSLPKNSSGKLLRAQLKAMGCEGEAVPSPASPAAAHL